MSTPFGLASAAPVGLGCLTDNTCMELSGYCRVNEVKHATSCFPHASPGVPACVPTLACLNSKHEIIQSMHGQHARINGKERVMEKCNGKE